MINITAQPWYNEADTPAQKSAALDVYVLANYDPLTMNDAQNAALIQFKTQIQIMHDKLTAKKDGFFAARDLAFAALSSQQGAEKIALGAEWQAYEDNDYQIP